MTVRGDPYSSFARIGECSLFASVKADLISYMWNTYESTKQWQIYYTLVEVMPEDIVRRHKIHGNHLTLFRRFIEDLCGHYSIETIDDWAEAAEGWPRVYRKKSHKLLRGPLDQLWELASSYSWPA